MFDFIDSSIDVHDLPNVLEARKIRKLPKKAITHRYSTPRTMLGMKDLKILVLMVALKSLYDFVPTHFVPCLCCLFFVTSFLHCFRTNAIKHRSQSSMTMLE